jgi:SpoIID/LytB domain protein
MLGTSNGIIWEGDAEMLDAPAGVPLTYRYGVFVDGQCSRRESGTMAHIFCPSKKRNSHYILNDTWKDLPSASHLYSSAFTVERGEVSETGVPQTFLLRGAGWGHGVGLCQIGAAVMAEQGYTFDEILAHYYEGAKLHKL